MAFFLVFRDFSQLFLLFIKIQLELFFFRCKVTSAVIRMRGSRSHGAGVRIRAQPFERNRQTTETATVRAEKSGRSERSAACGVLLHLYPGRGAENGIDMQERPERKPRGIATITTNPVRLEAKDEQ